MSFAITELAEKATVRLLPTAYFKPPVLQPLVERADDLDILAAVEGLTNRRRIAEKQGLADLDPRELAFRARAQGLQSWGHSHVNAAFVYTRPDGNRFNDGRRGAWYCAFDELTAIEEVAFHRSRELGFIGVYEDEMPYQALLADFIGSFPDLRGIAPPPDCLDPDVAAGYPAGQAFARDLRSEGWRGLVYPSVRRPGGTCFAAFDPQIVQNVRPGAKWLLSWTGTPHFTVTANPQ